MGCGKIVGKGAVLAVVAAMGSSGLFTVVANAQDEPSLVKAVPPEYPRAAERRGITGSVEAKLSVDAAGKVAAVEIVSADPPGVFDSAATEAFEKWTFEAGKPNPAVIKKISFQVQ